MDNVIQFKACLVALEARGARPGGVRGAATGSYRERAACAWHYSWHGARRLSKARSLATTQLAARLRLLRQARRSSNPQPPVLEHTPSNASVAAFVDSQGLSSGPATPASLDDGGVGTNPGTETWRQSARPSPDSIQDRLPTPTRRAGR